MSVPVDFAPFETGPAMVVDAGDADKDVDETEDDGGRKETMTEKEKRRLEVLLEDDVPELQVDASVISRLNAIDRELNMLKGERLKEGSRRSLSPQEEDVVAICDNGWNEAQNRLEMIEENMTLIQATCQKIRLLPLEDAYSRLGAVTITEDFLDENDD